MLICSRPWGRAPFQNCRAGLSMRSRAAGSAAAAWTNGVGGWRASRSGARLPAAGDLGRRCSLAIARQGAAGSGTPAACAFQRCPRKRTLEPRQARQQSRGDGTWSDAAARLHKPDRHETEAHREANTDSPGQTFVLFPASGVVVGLGLRGRAGCGGVLEVRRGLCDASWLVVWRPQVVCGRLGGCRGQSTVPA